MLFQIGYDNTPFIISVFLRYLDQITQVASFTPLHDPGLILLETLVGLPGHRAIFGGLLCKSMGIVGFHRGVRHLNG